MMTGVTTMMTMIMMMVSMIMTMIAMITMMTGAENTSAIAVVSPQTR